MLKKWPYFYVKEKYYTLLLCNTSLVGLGCIVTEVNSLSHHPRKNNFLNLHLSSYKILFLMVFLFLLVWKTLVLLLDFIPSVSMKFSFILSHSDGLKYRLNCGKCSRIHHSLIARITATLTYIFFSSDRLLSLTRSS